MRVLAWKLSPREAGGVAFVDLDRLLAESHAVSLHRLPTDGTRGFLCAARIARMRPGAILVNTARGALVDEAATLDASASGRLGHAALDAFGQEPPPSGHPLTRSERATLTAHRASHTPEAWETLLGRALDIVRRVAQT